MFIELEDDRLKTFARTNDAVKAFRNAVNNGQSRFAMEVLVEIIDHLTQDVDHLTQNVEDQSAPEPVKQPVIDKDPAPTKQPTKKQVKVEQEDEKTTAKEEKAEAE